MNKKYYRFYGGLLTAQENWLNKMSAKGYRLIKSEKLLYEFEECRPVQYQYRIEFIGEKSKVNAENYRTFLEDIGYKVFYKNMNLNYSIGKIRYRPWAEKGGRKATNATTYNKELLIIEKECDNTPFELHTSFEDKADYYKNLRNPWLCLFCLFVFLGIMNHLLVINLFALSTLIPAILYQTQIIKLRHESKTKEW